MQYDDELACQDPPSDRDSELSDDGLEIPQKHVVAKRRAPKKRGGAPGSKGGASAGEGDQQVAARAPRPPQGGLSAIDEFIESEFFKSGAWKKKPSPPAGEPEPPRKRKPRAPPRATKPKRQEEPTEPVSRYEERADFYDSVIIV